MRNLFIMTVSCFGLLNASDASSQSARLLQPFGPTVMVRSSPEPGRNLGVSGPSNVPPRWVLAQWGIPENLQPVINGSPSGWTTQNIYGRVKYYSALNGLNNVYELAQAGRACNVERDMFLSANSDNESGAFKQSSPISKIGSLYASVTLFASYFQTSSDCSYQYGQYSYAFILKSTGGGGYPPQVWFHQVTVGRDNLVTQNKEIQWCGPSESVDTQEFCSDDDVRNMNGGYMVITPNSGMVDFDLLPRIKSAITSNHKKQNANIRMDPDPSRWSIHSIYMGEILQGKTASTTQWASPRLDQYNGGTFCDGSKNIQWTCGAGKPPPSGWGDAGSGCWHRNTNMPCTP